MFRASRSSVGLMKCPGQGRVEGVKHLLSALGIKQQAAQLGLEILAAGRCDLVNLPRRVTPLLFGPGFLHISRTFELAEVVVQRPSAQVDIRRVQPPFNLLAQFIAVVRLLRQKTKNDELNAHSIPFLK